MAIEDRLEELFMTDSNNRRVTSVNVPQRPSPWRGVIASAGVAALAGIVAIAAILALRGEPQAAAPNLTASPIPTSSTVPTATTAATATPSPSATSVAPPFLPAGVITGFLGYPSDFIPAMKVFAVSTTDSSKWYRVDTVLNPPGNSYTLNVPAGTYKVYAYTSNSTPTNLAGGSYTEYVRCGMQPPCADHTVIVITVGAGQTTTGVDLRDWYAPQGAYPPPPA